MRVLIVEDEAKMAQLLRRAMREEGMPADLAERGEDALALAAETDYDVIVLDVLLPGIDGFETCRRLRRDGVRSPVLLLTALDGVEDRVAGLDGGADDYVTKPFSVAELLARIRALGRRGPIERAPMLEVGDLRLDAGNRRAQRGDTQIELSAREFVLLEALMRRPGELLSRRELFEQTFEGAYDEGSNVVDVYIHYLREKIDRPFGAESIETVRGAGYRLSAAP
ncbi:MAG: two-component system, OmpR family, response regulator [Solirubrobacterales bacterium]|jgi:two-component system OmpR family response regulator|nr:two-component system, OmpR family, response regulator [Solirubrobacterales bacterium]